MSETRAPETQRSAPRSPSVWEAEEVLNSITHAIGAGLSIAAMIVMLIRVARDPDPGEWVGYTVYGLSQILLYLSSALMHGFTPYPRLRAVLGRLDFASIYVLIAGTYTPISLTLLRGPWGWTILTIIWGLALAGIAVKSWILPREHFLSDLLYIPMGWLILVAFGPLIRTATPAFLAWAVAGGLSYSVGVAFYAWRRLPFNHLIWHFFVLAGSACFFVGYVTQAL